MSNTKTYRNYNIHEKAEDIVLIAIILSDNCCNELYDTLKVGYIETINTIKDMAIVFFNENLDTDWEDIIWDDAVIEFGGWEMVEVRKDPAKYLQKLSKRRNSL